MADRRDAGFGRVAAWAWAIAAAWAVGASAGEQPADGTAGAKPKGADVAKADTKGLMNAPGELQTAAREGEAHAVAQPKEPARKSVVKPTIEAAAVDAMLNKVLAAGKVQAARATTDLEFVRRIYLDVAGRLPNPDEIMSFCNDKRHGKRPALIDRLLDSPDYAKNWSRYWKDVVSFRAPEAGQNRLNYPLLEEWLEKELARNAPWDEVATAMITAVGRNDEVGPVTFALAEENDPVELAGETSRIFLGVQIQCAQCHDHPNDPWKREQFHQFAAFFQGVRAKNVVKGGMGMRPVFEVVNQPGMPRYTMPDIKDPTKKVPVEPKFFLAASPEPVPAKLTTEARRALLARYITAQDNPWFARAYVNRIWGVLLGEGFYNPIDDLGPARDAHAREVLDTLAAQWQAGGYDVKWLFRTILNTAAYQREARSTSTAAGRTPFAANCPTRLRSDQILDALSHALNIPLDGRPGPAGGKPGGAGGAAKKAANKGGGAAGALLNVAASKQPVQVAAKMAMNMMRRPNGPRIQFNLTFGVDPSTPPDDVLGTIPQALLLMNGPQINKAIEARNGTVLGEILARSSNPRAVLDALYLRTLARAPTAKEVGICDRYLMAVGNPKEAFEDIFWSLINSAEFVSRH